MNKKNLRNIFALFICLVLNCSCISEVEREDEILEFMEYYSSMSVYQQVEMIIGVDANILQCIAIAESGESDGIVGDGGISIGRMQINEKWREYRIKKYGEYDPRDAFQAVLLSAKIFKDSLSSLKSIDLAIAAHRQGIKGVIENGPTMWYVDKVKKNMPIFEKE